MFYFPTATAQELEEAGESLEALVQAVLSCDADASDRAMRDFIRREIEITLRSLQPAFGDSMDLTGLEPAE